MSLRYLVIILFVALTAHAQPQAPIEWQPIRLLMEADTMYYPDMVFSSGDTIVLTAIYGLTHTTPNPAAACVSGDNGQTWSPWYVFPYTGYSTVVPAQVAFTSQGILMCTNTDDNDRSFYRSTDLGYTWTHQSNHTGNLHIRGVHGDTILCRGVERGSITWTTDGGLSFAPERQIDMPRGSIESMALSGGIIHVVGRRAPEYPLRAAYSRGPFLSGAFTEPQWMNNVYFAAVTCVAFNEDGVGVIAALVNYTGPIPRPTAVLVNTTRDNGLTWSVADTFTTGETAGFTSLHLARQGPMWAIIWSDTIIDPGFTRKGKHFRFSANRARSWYPARQITDDSIDGGASTDLEIRPNRIRLNAWYHWWNGEYANHFFQWEGQIIRDTLTPVIVSADSLLFILPPDTLISLGSWAFDDDSLWLMEVVLRRAGQNDSTIVPLIRDTGNQYSAAWTVPNDTGTWTYYYRAEDMWENVSYYPSDGPASPWTFHVGPLSASENSNLQPSSFSLSVFPNPFNSRTTISYIVPQEGQATVQVFNITGKLVKDLGNGRVSAGEHRVTLDGSGLSSGVYFCRMEAGRVVQTRKIVLMK